MARPYNHPDNIDENGKPKMSEDAWALSEKIHDDVASMISSIFSELEALRVKMETLDALYESFNRLRAASAAMSAKVDSDATPVSSFTNDFNSLI